MSWRHLIQDVPDFPKKGILFKDITPVLLNGVAFRELTRELCDSVSPWKPQKLVAIESRGFILASAMAQQMGVGMALVRKAGKLPRSTVKASYSLEYGTDKIELHADAIEAGERIVVIDDVLATGGTLKAAIDLCRQVKADIRGSQVLIELGFLRGREQLAPIETKSLLML